MSRGLVALSMSAIAAIYVTGYVATQGADARLGASTLEPVAPIVTPAPPGAVARTAPLAPGIQQPPQIQAPSIQPPQAQPPQAQAPPDGRSFPSRRGPFQGNGAGEREGRGRGSSSPSGIAGVIPPANSAPPSSTAPGASAPAASQPGASSGGQAAGSAATQPGAATTSYRDGTYTGSGTSRRGGFEVAVTIQGGRITDVKFTRVTTQYPVSRVAGLPAEVIARQSAQVDRISGATYSVQAFQQAMENALAQARVSGSAVGAANGASSASGTAGA